MGRQVVILTLLVQYCHPGCVLDPSKSGQISVKEAMDGWQEASFGMYGHWGVYPVPAEFETENNSEDWTLQFSDPGRDNWQDHWFLVGEPAKVVNNGKGMNFSAGPIKES